MRFNLYYLNGAGQRVLEDLTLFQVLEHTQQILNTGGEITSIIDVRMD